MKLTDITKRMASLQRAIEKRQKKATDEALKQWLQGYLQGLAAVSEIIKNEQEIERAEQRLERLISDRNDAPEPDWSQAPGVAPNEASGAANTNTESGPVTQTASAQKAA